MVGGTPVILDVSDGFNITTHARPAGRVYLYTNDGSTVAVQKTDASCVTTTDALVTQAGGETLTNKILVDPDIRDSSGNRFHLPPTLTTNADLELVDTSTYQTLSNKVHVAPVMLGPRIYVTDNEMTFPTVTETGNFVFDNATQTLTNKTLTAPDITNGSATQTTLYGCSIDDLSGHNYQLPSISADTVLVTTDNTQTLTNKTLTSPVITTPTTRAPLLTDTSDTTKKVQTDLSNLTTGTTTNVRFPVTSGLNYTLQQGELLASGSANATATFTITLDSRSQYYSHLKVLIIGGTASGSDVNISVNGVGTGKYGYVSQYANSGSGGLAVGIAQDYWVVGPLPDTTNYGHGMIELKLHAFNSTTLNKTGEATNGYISVDAGTYNASRYTHAILGSKVTSPVAITSLTATSGSNFSNVSYWAYGLQ